MPTAQVTGLSSGIDWQETISLIMEVESQPMVMLEERKDTYQQKLEAWQEINSKLLSLKSTMESMNEMNELLKKAVSSTDTTVATASATSEAITGSYTVEVNQLALSDKQTHEGFVDENSTAVHDGPGDATFSYDYAGESYSITVAAGTTLAGLAAAINNDIDNPGVTATILNDGSGTSTAYHLVLTGETGASNAIENISSTLDNFSSVFTETQTAQDAQIRVDGYPPDPDWILSSTNEITEVISGVTLNLISANPGETITISVTNDTDATKDKIQEFVDAYNEVIALINLKTKYDAETETAGILFGDSSVISIKNDLQTIISSAIPGQLSNAPYSNLSAIGIESGSGGMLSVDDSKLSDALEDNFTEVGELFALQTTSTSNNLSYFYSTSETLGGVYNIVANYDASGQLTSATINGNEAQIDGDYIIGMDGNPEAGLRILFTDPGNGPGSISAEVRFITGAAVQVENRVEFLTDPVDGTVHYAQEGIQDTIDNIEEQIERWEERLAKKQEQLEAQFLQMEILVGQLQTQGNFISAMLSGM